MRFALFILLNAVLFIRPSELVPGLESAQIYEAVILVCLAVNAPGVLHQLTPGSLIHRTRTCCVLGVLVAVALSQFVRGDLHETVVQGTLFLKVVLYYLLLVTVVDSPSKLRHFLGWLAVLILGVTVLALLQHHEVINLPALEAFQQKEDDLETGDVRSFPRLCGPGIFHDPNDLSVILVVGMMVCLSRLGERGALRAAWLVPLGLMGYALTLTHSRGGFLALVAALGSLFVGRFGLRRACVFGAPVLVGLLMVFGGRQTQFDLGNRDDTSQHRIRIWREGLVLLKQSPLFGIGAGRYVEEVGLVAHNSFVHSYTELGFFGGTLFLVAFTGPIGALRRLGRAPAALPQPLRALRPCVMACLVGLVGGMGSLSRQYTLTPHVILGIVTVYLRLAEPWSPAARSELTGRLIGRWFLAGALFLVAANVVVLLLAGVG
jgi:hypothetical protein